MEIRKYEIRFIGRTLGAIGITYQICETVSATTEQRAILKLYEKFENIQVLSIIDVSAT